MARVACLTAQPARAARLLGVVTALFEDLGVRFWPAAQQEHDRLVALVQAELAKEAFAAALAQGRELTVEQAIALALES